MKIFFHDIKIFCKFYKHPNGDEVNFRSHVSGDLKRVFLINQTTPIATSQDILQNCSTERWDIYNYVLPINNAINRTFLFRYRGDKNNCDEGKNKSSWVQTDRFNTCQSLWLPKYSPRHRRRFLEEKASTYTALHHTASL